MNVETSRLQEAAAMSWEEEETKGLEGDAAADLEAAEDRLLEQKAADIG